MNRDLAFQDLFRPATPATIVPDERPFWTDARTPTHVAAVCPRPERGAACPSCAAPAEDRAPSAWETARVCDAMQRDVVCVRRETTLGALAELFLSRRLQSVPVVNEHGRAVGMVTPADLASWRGIGARHAVSEIMTELVFWMSENAPLARAARLMAREGVQRVPVVAGDRTVVGLLSTMDLVRWLALHGGVAMSPPKPR